MILVSKQKTIIFVASLLAMPLASAVAETAVPAGPFQYVPSVSNQSMVTPWSEFISRWQSEQSQQGQVSLDATAFLVQGVMSKQALIEILQVIDEGLLYWRSQKYHPLWYFANKGLYGWWSSYKDGTSAREEIAMKIAFLESVEQNYAELLGKVDALIKQSSKNIDLDYLPIDHKKYPWIEVQKQEALSGCAYGQKPSHWQRNWLTYTAAGVGLTLAGGFLYSKREALGQMVIDAQAGCKRLYNDHLAKPIQDFLDIFFDRTSSQVDLQVPDTNQKRQEVIHTFVQFNAAKKDSLKKAIDQLALSGELSIGDDIKKNIYNAIDLNDSKTVSALLGDAALQARHNLKTNTSIWSAITGNTQLNEALGDIVLVELTRLVDVNSVVIGSEMAKLVTLLLNDFFGPLEKTISAWMHEVQTLKQGQRTNTILLAIIPTVIATTIAYWGAKKGLSLFKRKAKDFQPMRQTLSAISKILNVYNKTPIIEMSDVDRGRLAYCCAKLEQQARMLLTEEQLDIVLSDINELGSRTFSIQQKLEVISRMRQDYGYLQVTAKAI